MTLLPGLERDRIQSTPIFWGLMGALAYCFFWTYLYWGYRTAFPDQSFFSTLSYESKYPYVFARELLRNGNFLFFNNPFGSLDGEPGLFHLYSSILRLLYPLWIHTPWVFDHLLGAFFSFLIFRELRLLMPEKVNLLIFSLCVFGGSFGALAIQVYPEFQWMKPMYFGMQPLLLFATSTSWLLFEFFLLKVLRHVVQGNALGSTLTFLVLTLFHPFFGVISALAILVGKATMVRNFPFDRKSGLIFLLGLLYLTLVPNFLHPMVSKDAEFFRQVYLQDSLTLMFRLDVGATLLFCGGPLLLSLFLVARSTGGNLLKLSQPIRFLGVVLGLLILISFSPVLGLDWIPQSGRWALANIHWIGLVLLAHLGFVSFRSPIHRVILFFLLFSMLADGLLVARQFQKNLGKTARPYAALESSEAALVERLTSLEPGRVLYLRNCSAEIEKAGDFEYLLMERTQHRTFFSHLYFTPNFGGLVQAASGCPESDQKLRSAMIRQSDYLIAGPDNYLDQEIADAFKLGSDEDDSTLSIWIRK